MTGQKLDDTSAWMRLFGQRLINLADLLEGGRDRWSTEQYADALVLMQNAVTFVAHTLNPALLAMAAAEEAHLAMVAMRSTGKAGE